MTTTPVTIRPLNLLGQDERGHTFDFSLSRQQQDFIYIFRKAHSLSGNTYHEGTTAATRPKTMVLFQGSLELSYRHKDSTEVTTLILNQPCVIEVAPFITHRVKALTDIMVLECNSTRDLAIDRHRLAVFPEPNA